MGLFTVQILSVLSVKQGRMALNFQSRVTGWSSSSWGKFNRTEAEGVFTPFTVGRTMLLILARNSSVL